MSATATPPSDQLAEAMKHYAEFARTASTHGGDGVEADDDNVAAARAASSPDRWHREVDAARELLVESDMLISPTTAERARRSWSSPSRRARSPKPAFTHSKRTKGSRKLGSPPRSAAKLGSPQRGTKLRSPQRGAKLGSPQRGSSGKRPAADPRVRELEAELLAEQEARRAMTVDYEEARERWSARHRQTIVAHERELHTSRTAAATERAKAERANIMRQQQHQQQPASVHGKDQARSMKAAIRELQQLKRQVKEMEAERTAERVRACVVASEEKAEERKRRQDLLDPPPHPLPNSVWTHYKHVPASPKRYRVVGVATHTKTELELVVYRALYGARELWVRPLRMWGEVVTVAQPWPNGAEQTRSCFLLQIQRPEQPLGSPLEQPEELAGSSAGITDVQQRIRYIALVQVMLREAADLSSVKVGTLSQDEEIEVLEHSYVDGAVRVRCARGWASVSTRKGKPLLAPLGQPQEGSEHVVARLADLANHIDDLLEDDSGHGQTSPNTGSRPLSIFRRPPSPTTVAAATDGGYVPKLTTPRTADLPGAQTVAAARRRSQTVAAASVSVTIAEDGKFGMDFGPQGVAWPVVESVAPDGLLAKFPEIQPGVLLAAIKSADGDFSTLGSSFKEAFNIFRKAGRPVTLTFSAPDSDAAEAQPTDEAQLQQSLLVEPETDAPVPKRFTLYVQPNAFIPIDGVTTVVAEAATLAVLRSRVAERLGIAGSVLVCPAVSSLAEAAPVRSFEQLGSYLSISQRVSVWPVRCFYRDGITPLPLKEAPVPEAEYEPQPQPTAVEESYSPPFAPSSGAVWSGGEAKGDEGDEEEEEELGFDSVMDDVEDGLGFASVMHERIQKRGSSPSKEVGYSRHCRPSIDVGLLRGEEGLTVSVAPSLGALTDKDDDEEEPEPEPEDSGVLSSLAAEPELSHSEPEPLAHTVAAVAEYRPDDWNGLLEVSAGDEVHTVDSGPMTIHTMQAMQDLSASGPDEVDPGFDSVMHESPVKRGSSPHADGVRTRRPSITGSLLSDGPVHVSMPPELIALADDEEQEQEDAEEDDYDGDVLSPIDMLRARKAEIAAEEPELEPETEPEPEPDGSGDDWNGLLEASAGDAVDSGPMTIRTMQALQDLSGRPSEVTEPDPDPEFAAMQAIMDAGSAGQTSAQADFEALLSVAAPQPEPQPEPSLDVELAGLLGPESSDDDSNGPAPAADAAGGMDDDDDPFAVLSSMLS